MDGQIQARLDALEGAIDVLVTSISTLNPSAAAAEALLDADDDLNDEITKLVQHQRNCLILQQLRSTTEALDERLKYNLASLADVRNELIKSTPVSAPPKGTDTKPINTDDLLKFAQLIAGSSVPALKRPAAAEPEGLMTSVETSVKQEGGTPQPGQSYDAVPKDNADAKQQATMPTTTTSKAIASLNPELRAWLEQPNAQATFSPWVNEDQSRKSALSQIDEALTRDTDNMA